MRLQQECYNVILKCEQKWTPVKKRKHQTDSLETFVSLVDKVLSVHSRSKFQSMFPNYLKQIKH